MTPMEELQAKYRPVKAFGAPAPGGGTTPEDPLFQKSYTGGFLSSAISSIPELFGADPTTRAMEFRAEHPISGFVSEMIPTMVPYGAAFKASQIPSMAARLESAVGSTMARLGTDAATAPVRAGMIRETLRYMPVEVGRLGVGGVLYPENFGNLFADVAISTALTGGAGMLGGWLKAGGELNQAKVADIVGAQMDESASYQLRRVLDDPDAWVGTPEARDEWIATQRQKVLDLMPAELATSKSKKRQYIPLLGEMEHGSPDDGSQIASHIFYGLGKGKANKGIQKQKLLEGDGRDFSTLNSGEQALLLEKMPEGINTIDDLAKNVDTPRVITAHGEEGARALSGVMSRDAWEHVGPGLYMAKEVDGPWVMGMKLSEDANKAKWGTGVGEVAEDSKWFFTRTTNPKAFAPTLAKIGESVEEGWIRRAQQFQPGRFSDPFNKAMDLANEVLSPVHVNAMAKAKSKEEATGIVKARLGEIMDQQGREGGILDTYFGVRDSKSLHDLSEYLAVTFQPTQFLERRNSFYGRMHGLMKAVVETANRTTHELNRGKERLLPGGNPFGHKVGKDVEVTGYMGYRPRSHIVDDFTPEEANIFGHMSAANAMTPEKARVLVKEGIFTEKAAKAVDELHAIDKSLRAFHLEPAFKNTQFEGAVDWLEGTTGLPRIWKGDSLLEVRNEKGGLMHMVTAENGQKAQAIGRVIQAEAKTAGKNWTLGEVRNRKAVAKDEGDLEALYESVTRKINNTEEDAAIIEKAARRVAMFKGQKPAEVPMGIGTLKKRKVQAPHKESTVYSKDDILNAYESHDRTILTFAGMQTWHQRFGPMAKQWGASNRLMHDDLMRKSQQYLGFKGEITHALDKALTPVFGTSLGGQAATRIAASVNKGLFYMQLGMFNTSYAALNVLGIAQTVAPWIAMTTRAPVDVVASKMQTALPAFDQAGKPIGAVSVLEPFRIIGNAFSSLRNPSDELREFWGRLRSDGALKPQHYENWAGAKSKNAETLKEAYQRGGMPSAFMKMSTWMADSSEELSRMIAANSAYLVGKHHMKLEGENLYRWTKQGLEATMYRYGTTDRSRIFTGPVGSMFGLFKNWQVHFIGNMLEYGGMAARGETFAPLMWTGASALAIGGIGATPLKYLADGYANWASDAPDGYTYMVENWRDSADELWFGLPALMGGTLQASASIPGTDIRNELGHLGSFVVYERGKALFKALGQAGTIWNATGENPMKDPNVVDAMLGATMPRVVHRVASVIEGEYVKSMNTGYPMATDISPAGKMMHGFGFNSLEIERAQLVARGLWKDQEARQEMTQGLGQTYANAWLEGDSYRMDLAIKQAMVHQIELSKVLKSAQTRIRREQEGDLMSRYEAERAERARTAVALGEKYRLLLPDK